MKSKGIKVTRSGRKGRGKQRRKEIGRVGTE